MRTRMTALLLATMLMLLAAAPAMAHGPVPRVPEVWETAARLFAADAANGDLIVIDLPDGKVVTRLSTPAYVMNLGLTVDERHLFVTRGRNTDRDFVTVINTAFDQATGVARLPYVSRTFEGFSPGGARKGEMTPVAGSTSMVNELRAELLTFSGDFDGLGAVAVQLYKLAGPDHYHYAEIDGTLYVGHLRMGLVQILDVETGNELGRVTGCPVVHGIALDQESGRLFFGCQTNTLVVGSQGEEAGKAVARIAYPEQQRVAAFIEGKERVFWGYTEGTLPMLYRLDAKQQPYAYETVTVAPSIRQAVSADMAYLLSLTRAGALEIRDSASGDLLRSVIIGKGWDADFHEHVDKAVLPDIVTLGQYGFVSLPNEGRIAQVDLNEGKLVRYLRTGGEPTRLVILAHSELPDLDHTHLTFVSGDATGLPAAPFMQEGKLWLPLRAVAEALGARVEWQAETARITKTLGDREAALAIGDSHASVNGVAEELHGVPVLLDGLTYVKACDLARLLGFGLEEVDDWVTFHDHDLEHDHEEEHHLHDHHHH